MHPNRTSETQHRMVQANRGAAGHSKFIKDARLREESLFIQDGFIGGMWVPAENGKVFPVYEPSSGEILGNVADMSRDDFIRAIKIADEGFRKYSASTTFAQRGLQLRKWFDLIHENIEDLGKILSLENGKTLGEAKGEVVYAASFIQWFSEEAPRVYGDVIPSSLPNTTVFTLKQPVGVCGIITPWNFPAAMITRKIAPAFAAGCSVVIKPPSETPYSCLAFVKLAVEAGIPPDCVHVVPTKDRDAATELATNPIVKKISFTGSTSVGKILTRLAAGTMKKVSMELGGNAPFIVFDDADLDKAVEGAIFCKFRNSGQTCVCANRLFVHEAVYDKFTELLKEKVSKFKLGFGLDPATTHGPLVNASAVKKVLEHVNDAKSKGAQVVLGGKAPEHLKGFFFEPTILTGVTKDMMVSNDETFGPLAPLYKFSSDAEVIEMANDTEFGLAGYFFSKDFNRIWRVAAALECGMVGVNTGKISAAESPFGGVKESGIGREGSKYGIAEYQNIKAIIVGNLDP